MRDSITIDISRITEWEGEVDDYYAHVFVDGDADPVLSYPEGTLSAVLCSIASDLTGISVGEPRIVSISTDGVNPGGTYRVPAGVVLEVSQTGPDVEDMWSVAMAGPFDGPMPEPEAD